MYWKQGVGAFGFGSLSAYLALRYDLGVVAAIGIGLLSYVSFRVLVATWFRTRYWFHRGTKGVFGTNCLRCGQYIYRIRGDWFLKCHRCGWTRGRPVIRWITGSVPSVQFRRSLTRTRIVVTLLAIGLILASTPAVTSQFSQSREVSFQSPIVVEPPQNETNPDQQQEVVEADQTSVVDGVDFRATEEEILRRTNEIRNTRGLSILSRDEYLHQRALEHSRDMAANEYYSHAGPNGESPESRLRAISATCGGPSSENIHRGELFIEMRIYGSSETVYMDDVEGITRYAVRGWMNSEGHRENMLNPGWRMAGVGVNASDTQVFMTIIFC